MKKHSFLALLLVATGVGFGQTNTHEEAVMRETYAKLAYAVQTTAVIDAIKADPTIDSATLNREVNAQELRFTIKDMTAGTLREIVGKSVSDYLTVSEPGEGLDLRLTSAPTGGIGQMEVRPAWQAPPAVTRGPGTAPDMTVGKVLLMSDGKAYDRYAAATVTVLFQARAHTYKTMWLFDSRGKQPVLPNDLILGTNLQRLVDEDMTPNALLDIEGFTSNPAVRQWLRTNELPDGTCEQTLCCPPSRPCAVSASAVTKALDTYPERAGSVRRIPHSVRPVGRAAATSTAPSPYLLCCASPTCYDYNYSRTGSSNPADTAQHIIGNHAAAVTNNI